MRSTALPVSCNEDVTVDFLSHLPSFEFYGFQSLEREGDGSEIKTKYIHAHNREGTDRRRSCCEEECQPTNFHSYFFLRHWSPTRGQPGCIMRPAATFVDCIKAAINRTQQFRQLAISLTVIFPRAARKQAHNNGCGPSPQKVCRAMPFGRAESECIMERSFMSFTVLDCQIA
jgi:hypothetical protein